MSGKQGDVILPPLSTILPRKYFQVESPTPLRTKRNAPRYSNTNIFQALANNARSPRSHAPPPHTPLPELSRTAQHCLQPHASNSRFQPIISTTLNMSSRNNIEHETVEETVRKEFLPNERTMPTTDNLLSAKEVRNKPLAKFHVCKQCGKQFTRPSALATHSLVHSGDKPFACPWGGCSKKFNVKSNLMRHLKLHQKKMGRENGRKSFRRELYDEGYEIS